MNSKAESPTSTLDTVKLVIAFLIVSGAVAAYYYFGQAPLIARVGGLLAAVIVAIAVALQTDKGRQLAGFFKESQLEVRKVVWPTRQESMQTTLIVLVVVVIVSILLWGLDAGIGWIVQRLIGS
ncbi:MAG: preprotein translocase subunit SecE [Gammaproteobacteria bacterium]